MRTAVTSNYFHIVIVSYSKSYAPPQKKTKNNKKQKTTK